MNVEKRYFCDFCDYSEDIGQKELESVLFTCQSCQLVKYCSVDCQGKAKPNHEEFCLQRTKDLQELSPVTSKFPSVKTALEDKDFVLFKFKPTLNKCQKELLNKLENETYVIAEQKQDYFCYQQGMELCWYLMCDAMLTLEKMTPRLGPVLDIGLATHIVVLKHEIALLGGKLSLYELILDMDPHRSRNYIPIVARACPPYDYHKSRFLSQVESKLIFSHYSDKCFGTESVHSFWIEQKIPRLYWSFVNILHDLSENIPNFQKATKSLKAFTEVLESYPLDSSAQRLVKTDVVMDCIKKKMFEMVRSDYETYLEKADQSDYGTVHSVCGFQTTLEFKSISFNEYLYGFKAFYGNKLGGLFLHMVGQNPVPDEIEESQSMMEFANRCYRYISQDEKLLDFIITREVSKNFVLKFMNM